MMPRRQPRRPSIGFVSAIESICASSLRLAASSSASAPAHSARDDLDLELARVVEELVQRRVEQADRDGQAVHRLEDAEVVADLHLEQLGERGLAARPRLGEDQVLDDLLPLAEEHVLGAAQADALRRRTCGRAPRRRACRRWRARPSCGTRRPTSRMVSKSPETSGSTSATAPSDDDAGRAVDGDDVALVQLDVGALDARDLVLGVDLELLGAAHARLAHAARDDRRVRGLAAVADVRMPCAATMPCRSSGVVSQRTRMTLRPVGLGGYRRRRRRRRPRPRRRPGER